MSLPGHKHFLHAGVTLACGASIALVLALMLTSQARVPSQGTDESAPPSLVLPVAVASDPAIVTSASAPAEVAGKPAQQAVKGMLYRAAVKHGVNPALVMGVAWWESGWDQRQVSSTGAIGIMQVEPYTADSAGPTLLHRQVDIHEAAENIDLGAAILRANLEQYHGNLMNALVAYYAGPTAVGDWGHLAADEQRYVLGVYSLAMAFSRGQGPA